MGVIPYYILPPKGYSLESQEKEDGSTTSLCVTLDISWALNFGEYVCWKGTDIQINSSRGGREKE